MSETKFTPGPWRVAPAHIEKNNKFIDASSGPGVAQEVCCVGPTLEFEQSLANAHLIAAAPEMYAMLENLSRLLTDVNAHQVVNDIESLLAKARGEA